MLLLDSQSAVSTFSLDVMEHRFLTVSVTAFVCFLVTAVLILIKPAKVSCLLIIDFCVHTSAKSKVHLIVFLIHNATYRFWII